MCWFGGGLCDWLLVVHDTGAWRHCSCQLRWHWPCCCFLQAQQALVRSFKRLRGDDAAPGSHSAYRITVRQLEALVRLSEAMARVYLSPVVTGEHVAEVGKPGCMEVCQGRKCSPSCV
eukprot:GHUV01041553.1.p1 GENE.GHUV01041553.1~~GHUV01041553.1.p1  ORF type:complete len:118 (-),score=30.33 GHUV01041553.1:101-454(-)